MQLPPEFGHSARDGGFTEHDKCPVRKKRLFGRPRVSCGREPCSGIHLFPPTLSRLVPEVCDLMTTSSVQHRTRPLLARFWHHVDMPTQVLVVADDDRVRSIVPDTRWKRSDTNQAISALRELDQCVRPRRGRRHRRQCLHSRMPAAFTVRAGRATPARPLSSWSASQSGAGLSDLARWPRRARRSAP